MNSVLLFNPSANYMMEANEYVESVPIYSPTNMGGNQNMTQLSHELQSTNLEANVLTTFRPTHVVVERNMQVLQPLNMVSQNLPSMEPASNFASKSPVNISDYCLCGVGGASCLESSNSGSECKEFKTSTIKKTRCIPKTEEDSVILKGYQFKFRHENSNGRKKKIIVCKYDGCQKEFTKTWSFLYHARMHEGEKPFQCDVCQRAFSQKSNLTKHMKHHVLTTVSERKLFKCSMCPKGYTERYNLRVRKVTPVRISIVFNIEPAQ